MRSRLITILAAAALALILPAGASAAKPPRDFYGVVPQGGLTANDYAMLGGANVGTLRVEFDWAAVQNGSGKCQADGGACNWGSTDALVANAAAHGIRIFPTLYGVPRFVSKHHNDAPTKGKDLKRWRSFVAAAARRYGPNGVFWQGGGPPPEPPPPEPPPPEPPPPEPDPGGGGGYVGENGGLGHRAAGGVFPITDWQIWNEQNSKQFWRGKSQPKAYGKLLKASATEIRAQDSNATIVVGGMYGFAKQTLESFMKELYRVKKIERSFDAIAIHPYSPTVLGLKKQISIARRTAKKSGDRGVKIQMTEMGWSSGGGKHPLDKGKKGQAKLLKKSFKLLTKKRGAWNIDALIWFAYNDTNLKTCAFCRNSGLVNTNSQPKPAWREFVRFTQ